MVKFSTLHRGVRAMTTAECGRCDRDADLGAYCRSCADGIMAKALTPFLGGLRKNGGYPPPPKPVRTSAQHSLFRFQP